MDRRQGFFLKGVMKFFLSALALMLFLALGNAALADTVYYLFRHAEKNTENPDPGLTEEGQIRARNLADFLIPRGVTRIFSTDTKRTRDTVVPLAQRLGLEIEIYDGRDLPGFAEKLKGIEGVIVVSGHSNTTPELAALVSGQETEYMPESEYDRLYAIILTDGGESILNVTRQK